MSDPKIDRPKKQKYGLDWLDRDFPNDLDIEFYFIRQGGHVKIGEKVYGLGKEHHYTEAAKLLWPDDDWHRWFNLCWKRIIQHEICVMMGASDSGKTYVSAKYVLTDWWANSENTLWMISSTELRGAELRIWGKIKELFNRARKLYPNLPGNVLESKHAIATEAVSDDNSEARLLTKGIIFIPCISNGQWKGLGNFAGVKPTKDGRIGHVGDECFPAGTMVDTPKGRIPIEQITPGEEVFTACGVQKVVGVINRTSHSLLRVLTSDRREVLCTPEHPFLTNSGWKRARDLKKTDQLLNHHETLRILQSENQQTAFLQSLLLSEMASPSTGMVETQSEVIEHRQTQILTRASRMERESISNPNGENPFSGNPNENCRNGKAIGDYNQEERREWNRPNQSRIAVNENGSEWNLELLHKNRAMERQRVPTSLQSRCGHSSIKTGDRGRWKFSQIIGEEGTRPKKGLIFKGTWVDSVEIYESSNFGLQVQRESFGGYRVYNLQVDGHPSYSVNGCIVHNCSFMQNSFLKAYANWYGKPQFKGILQGNPIDLDDPLCVAAEPADGEGWKDWKDTEKTQEWRSKWYNAWVIALDGRDSPNMDYPANRNPFPYLVGRKKLESVAEVEGKDSDLFWMQCIGKPRPGAEIRRIITRQLCESGKAFEPVVWEGSSVTDVVSLDAAYGGEGGDRCVLTHLQFGKDVDGTSILFYAGRYNVPVTHRVPEKPEVQIATFCKNWCEARKIPPAHFFYDARSTLADAFGKWWSPEVNAVDFGGLPTDRPVSNEHYVLDEVTKVKRLKRCNEHYSKFVTELWFSAHYLILYQQLRGLVREVAEEGWKRQWHPTKGSPPRVEAETKADMKERTTYSPDNFDSFVTGIEGARRLGFQIGKLSNAALQGKDPFEYLQNQANKFRTSMKKQELRYD